MSAGPVVTIPLSLELVMSVTRTSTTYALQILRDGTVINNTITESVGEGTSVQIYLIVPTGHVLELNVPGTTTLRTNPFMVSSTTEAEHATEITLTSATAPAATAKKTLKVKIEAKPTTTPARPTITPAME